MPGRQSTGPLIQKNTKVKKQIKRRALNALAIAEQQEPERIKIRHNRLGDLVQQDDKRKRVLSEDGADEEEGDRAIRKKPRVRQTDRLGDQVEAGSDSDGNEWVIGQAVGEGDSDLDSDEAMGESDENRFEDFTFRGSSTRHSHKKSKTSPHGENLGIQESDTIILDEGEESDGFREKAVDLADVLDADFDEQYENNTSEDKEISDSQGERNSTEDEDSSDDHSSELSISTVDDEINDTAKLSALQTLVTSMGDGTNFSSSNRDRNRDAQELSTPSEFGLDSKQKLTVADLITTVTDPKLKKSLKLLTEDNAGPSRKRSSTVPQKLDVPLAKRQQDRLDRAAAYEKSKETLNRWIDTVKHNRRAEHLSFPLQDPEAFAAIGTTRLLPTPQSKPMTSLESTIQNILVDSGLLTTDGKSQEDRIQTFEELQTNKMPIEEVQAKRAELRKARELLFREEIRAKRIKKIKSKSYRRVHRRERDRNSQREKEALAAAGLDISEDEQEQNDRRRAEERMGARHRESKWAKGVKYAGRTVWDENARNGVVEMAKREEDLRRRIEGKQVNNEDDDSSSSNTGSSDGDEEEDADDDQKALEKLHNRLGDLDSKSTENPFKQNGQSSLTSMKFMQNAEKKRREQNDLAVERLRREMLGEDLSDELEEGERSGRRKYGPTTDSTRSLKIGSLVKRNEFEEGSASDDEVPDPDQSISSKIDTGVGNAEKPKTSILLKSGQGYEQRGHKDTNSSSRAKVANIKGGNPWLSSDSKTSSSKERKSLASDSTVLISNTPDMSHSVSSMVVRPISKPEKVPPHAESPSSPASFSGFSSDPDSDTPRTPSMLPNNQDLIRQAFAGDEVIASFEAEKIATMKEEEDKVIDNTLPGWGSWTGVGLSKNAERRNKGKVFERKEGIKKEKRVDWGLEKVIINEKRVKKVGQFSWSLDVKFELISENRIPNTLPPLYLILSRRASSMSARSVFQ